MCTEKTPKWKQWGLNQYLAPLQFLETRHIHFEPCSKRESDTTERLHFHSSLSCIGDGNGNPLQCPCLENPRDGGAWRAAVYGVAQGRTRLSSSSSKGTNVFPGGTVVKKPSANAGDVGSIPGSGSCPGIGNGNPLRYSCLGNPMDRAQWATSHGVMWSRTLLSD